MNQRHLRLAKTAIVAVAVLLVGSRAAEAEINRYANRHSSDWDRTGREPVSLDHQRRGTGRPGADRCRVGRAPRRDASVPARPRRPARARRGQWLLMNNVGGCRPLQGTTIEFVSNPDIPPITARRGRAVPRFHACAARRSKGRSQRRRRRFRREDSSSRASPRDHGDASTAGGISTSSTGRKQSRRDRRRLVAQLRHRDLDRQRSGSCRPGRSLHAGHRRGLSDHVRPVEVPADVRALHVAVADRLLTRQARRPADGAAVADQARPSS